MLLQPLRSPAHGRRPWLISAVGSTLAQPAAMTCGPCPPSNSSALLILRLRLRRGKKWIGGAGTVAAPQEAAAARGVKATRDAGARSWCSLASSSASSTAHKVLEPSRRSAPSSSAAAVLEASWRSTQCHSDHQQAVSGCSPAPSARVDRSGSD
ncbi:hypothetical protein BS78_K235000 [Paspalum vaginatum]|uniref:Uncharacterized protein n=1 Tax=Paspalum vaginatum TaxID=158149 RepID=A0A9W7X7Q3_9POAL|nr:hypothetical protein BS78_K235000 [Paspalum vaginatum]